VVWASAGGLAVGEAAVAGTRQTVSYQVKGFTCIACAVGLETMLRQQKGIANVQASYSKASVWIEFDPGLVTEQSLKELISDMGFRAEDAHTK
jgi:copper chaperone CopZ